MHRSLLNQYKPEYSHKGIGLVFINHNIIHVQNKVCAWNLNAPVSSKVNLLVLTTFKSLANLMLVVAMLFIPYTGWFSNVLKLFGSLHIDSSCIFVSLVSHSDSDLPLMIHLPWCDLWYSFSVMTDIHTCYASHVHFLSFLY